MTPAPVALRPREVAARLAVKTDVILGFIRAGVLRALDVSPAGSRRRTWRILPGDLASFEASRMAQPPRPAVRRRRTDPSIITFF
jgi:hypothetical protein